MANKSRIIQIRAEWFVDLQLTKGVWKHHKTCKSEDEAMRLVESARHDLGAEFVGIERDKTFNKD